MTSQGDLCWELYSASSETILKRWYEDWNVLDGKESVLTAETKRDHQKIHQIFWQKTVHDKKEDEIQELKYAD